MKAMKLPKLRVSVSNQCQLRCSFCGGEKLKMENFQPAYMSEMISTEELIFIIHKYIEATGLYVQFTGGEPLLNRDIVKLVRKTSEAGGFPEINTNGFSLNPEIATQLQESGLNVFKVSIPSFDPNLYKQITGVDGLSRVFKNIRDVKDIINIRINTVAMKHTLTETDLMIDTCREIGVKQLLLLELLYYPHLSGAKEFFREQYVDIKKVLRQLIERKLMTKFEEFQFFTEFKNPLFLARSSVDSFEVYFKQANPVLRLSDCYNCQHFCQEGIYELRLSTGGYLNFCNIPTKFGVDLSIQEILDNIERTYEEYRQLFSNGKDSYFEEFLEFHQI